MSNEKYRRVRCYWTFWWWFLILHFWFLPIFHSAHFILSFHLYATPKKPIRINIYFESHSQHTSFFFSFRLGGIYKTEKIKKFQQQWELYEWRTIVRNKRIRDYWDDTPLGQMHQTHYPPYYRVMGISANWTGKSLELKFF